MFWHNFKYSLKTLAASKMLIFWTFIFPIVLGTLFSLAFSDIEKNEKLDIIDIAIVENQAFNDSEIYKEAFKELSKENDDQLFNIQYVSLEDAEKLLGDNEITGYLLFEENDETKIVVSTSGINQTVLRYVVDQIKSNKEMIETLSKKEIEEMYKTGNFAIDYEKIVNHVMEIINNDSAVINNITGANLSYTMVEYYTLIAMTCLYGGILSMFIINYRLPNMNSVGKRVSITPISKGSMILGSLFASFIVQLFGVAILFIFTIFVINVDYGSNLPYIILLAIMGSLAGLSLGLAVASLVKANEGSKTGILIAITMVCCFLSGMMGITIKYYIDKSVPFINYLNPANMITDGLYSLYYYSTFSRYFFNIISLTIFSIIMIVLSYNSLRRQKYDSI